MKEQIIEILESYGFLGYSKFEYAHNIVQDIKARLQNKPKGIYTFWIYDTKIKVKKG